MKSDRFVENKDKIFVKEPVLGRPGLYRLGWRRGNDNETRLEPISQLSLRQALAILRRPLGVGDGITK